MQLRLWSIVPGHHQSRGSGRHQPVHPRDESLPKSSAWGGRPQRAGWKAHLSSTQQPPVLFLQQHPMWKAASCAEPMAAWTGCKDPGVAAPSAPHCQLTKDWAPTLA